MIQSIRLESLCSEQSKTVSEYEINQKKYIWTPIEHLIDFR